MFGSGKHKVYIEATGDAIRTISYDPTPRAKPDRNIELKPLILPRVVFETFTEEVPSLSPEVNLEEDDEELERAKLEESTGVVFTENK